MKWIEEFHRSNEFRQLAHELSVAFLTFGAVKDVETSKKKILIEELNDNERDLRDETFDNAFACLNDTSLPIRAHGLILFRRLIERADDKTLSNIDDPQSKLFEKFQEHLHAEDSYEYLAAINVLSVLTNRYTDKILPILCDEYFNQNQTRRRKTEDQLKVGEILVKITRLLGKGRNITFIFQMTSIVYLISTSKCQAKDLQTIFWLFFFRLSSNSS